MARSLEDKKKSRNKSYDNKEAKNVSNKQKPFNLVK